MQATGYRGRLAPSPTGLMHVGHARTFWIAEKRARQNQGVLVYRNDDLDRARCKPELDQAARRDLHDFGLRWQEGPGMHGPVAPYNQSERQPLYLKYWQVLHATGWIYPCQLSRRDLNAALSAPHEPEAQAARPIFPVHLRPPAGSASGATEPGDQNWRLRVPDDYFIKFNDLNFGAQSFQTGVDLGDFLIWRRDGFPSYEFAVVVDDHLMQISEVVRGADLLLSTARQRLIYQALEWAPPDFFHVPLVLDDAGKRLAKRHDALSLRSLLDQGLSPDMIRRRYF